MRLVPLVPDRPGSSRIVLGQVWKAASHTSSTLRHSLGPWDAPLGRPIGTPKWTRSHSARARSHVTTALASQATAEDDVELRAQWEVGVGTRSVTTDSSTQYIRFNIFNWYVVSSRCLSVVLKINTANTANTQYYWPVSLCIFGDF